MAIPCFIPWLDVPFSWIGRSLSNWAFWFPSVKKQLKNDNQRNLKENQSSYLLTTLFMLMAKHYWAITLQLATMQWPHARMLWCVCQHPIHTAAHHHQFLQIMMKYLWWRLSFWAFMQRRVITIVFYKCEKHFSWPNLSYLQRLQPSESNYCKMLSMLSKVLGTKASFREKWENNTGFWHDISGKYLIFSEYVLEFSEELEGLCLQQT